MAMWKWILLPLVTPALVAWGLLFGFVCWNQVDETKTSVKVQLVAVSYARMKTYATVHFLVRWPGQTQTWTDDYYPSDTDCPFAESMVGQTAYVWLIKSTPRHGSEPARYTTRSAGAFCPSLPRYSQ